MKPIALMRTIRFPSRATASRSNSLIECVQAIGTWTVKGATRQTATHLPHAATGRLSGASARWFEILSREKHQARLLLSITAIGIESYSSLALPRDSSSHRRLLDIGLRQSTCVAHVMYHLARRCYPMPCLPFSSCSTTRMRRACGSWSLAVRLHPPIPRRQRANRSFCDERLARIGWLPVDDYPGP